MWLGYIIFGVLFLLMLTAVFWVIVALALFIWSYVIKLAQTILKMSGDERKWL